MNDWNRLPEQKRQEIKENFRRIFELSDREKAKVLHEMSEGERERMQKTLETFARLPKAQRERCVEGFQRFTELSPAQRQQFLNNAELWKTMNGEDRAAWRALINSISTPRPPLPSELINPPLPPSQPAFPKRPMVVTNNF